MIRAAALPLYDWPELREATDGFWSILAQRLEAAGLSAPVELTRDQDPAILWDSPGLLISQSCGLRHVDGAARGTRIICAPVYEVEGCGAGRMSAVILGRRDGPADLAALQGARYAVEGPDSRFARAALLDAIGAPALGETVWAPTPREALIALADGRAEAACLDALSWALARLHEPAAAGLVPLAWTDAVAAPPFVTSALTETGDRARIRAALVETLLDPRSEPLRQALGFARVVALGDPDYDPLRRLARLARSAPAPA